jgi:predicted MPP superfamily phosphohydrolase
MVLQKNSPKNNSLIKKSLEPSPDNDHRQEWIIERKEMEESNTKQIVLTETRSNRGEYFSVFLDILTPVFFNSFTRKFLPNLANKFIVNHETHEYVDLPISFDGKRIMHLSDIHLGDVYLDEDKLISLIKENVADILVITGDFADSFKDTHLVDEFLNKIKEVEFKLGKFVILGNHDSYKLVPVLEKAGLTVLVNEFVDIDVNDNRIRLVGTDDVHYFYSPNSIKCLDHCKDVFSIALVHSPEVFDYAADAGAKLYLCGHTHGGQINPFKKIPLITRCYRGRKYFQGKWKYKNMIGYTHRGIGSTGMPIRIGPYPEVVIHTLELKI